MFKRCKKVIEGTIKKIEKQEPAISNEEKKGFDFKPAFATVEETEKVNVKNGEYKKPSIRAIALYYYFLITKGIELSFDDREGGKTKAMKNITDD